MFWSRIVYKVLMVSFVLMVHSSCASFNRAGVALSSGAIYQASTEIQSEANWEILRKSIPGNLKLLEGLHSVNPKNRNLLASLTKGYAGQAFAVDETLWLKDYLRGTHRNSPHGKQAIYNYSRALKYGLIYLSSKGVSYEELKQLIRTENGVFDLLDTKLSSSSDRDLEVVLFTAQSLAGLINLQRTDMIILAELPVAKEMFDWVCANRPKINFGACDIFYGAYEAGRPVMLGGNPEKGKEHFLRVIEKFPDNWLGKISYMQYYLIPLGHQDEFEALFDDFYQHEKALDDYLSWHPMREDDLEINEDLLIFKSIAIKRFQIINQLKSELF